MLEICELTKIYSENRGLHHANFSAVSGECIAVTGHNGAGKSTLLKILGGWVAPDSGSAFIDGAPVSDRFSLSRKVGFIPELPNLYDNFSVEYNLGLFARLFRVSSRRVARVMEQFDLVKFRNSRAGLLSKGFKQRLSIARSLLPDPPVMLFDEPTSGLDAGMTKEIHNLIQSLHDSGKTVLFTSHRAEETGALATRVIILREGTIIFDGFPGPTKPLDTESL